MKVPFTAALNPTATQHRERNGRTWVYHGISTSPPSDSLANLKNVDYDRVFLLPYSSSLKNRNVFEWPKNEPVRWQRNNNVILFSLGLPIKTNVPQYRTSFHVHTNCSMNHTTCSKKVTHCSAGAQDIAPFRVQRPRRCSHFPRYHTLPSLETLSRPASARSSKPSLRRAVGARGGRTPPRSRLPPHHKARPHRCAASSE